MRQIPLLTPITDLRIVSRHGEDRAYTGEKIDVYFNTAICQHSGNCVRGSAKLFNLKRKPWIIPDEVDVATVVKVIDTCPSGALQYRHK